jgi:hypothetical protein
MADAAYGLWPLVIVNTLLFASRTVWRGVGRICGANSGVRTPIRLVYPSAGSHTRSLACRSLHVLGGLNHGTRLRLALLLTPLVLAPNPAVACGTTTRKLVVPMTCSVGRSH